MRKTTAPGVAAMFLPSANGPRVDLPRQPRAAARDPRRSSRARAARSFPWCRRACAAPPDCRRGNSSARSRPRSSETTKRARSARRRVELRLVDAAVERCAQRDVGLQQRGGRRRSRPTRRSAKRRSPAAAASSSGRRRCARIRRPEPRVLPRWPSCGCRASAPDERRRGAEHVLAPDADERIGGERVLRRAARPACPCAASRPRLGRRQSVRASSGGRGVRSCSGRPWSCRRCVRSCRGRGASASPSTRRRARASSRRRSRSCCRA